MTSSINLGLFQWMLAIKYLTLFDSMKVKSSPMPISVILAYLHQLAVRRVTTAIHGRGKKLLASGDTDIEQHLAPTFDEWIGSLPSWKLKDKTLSNCNSRCLLFSIGIPLAVYGACNIMLQSYNRYNSPS